jgi:hypothetical protein
MATKKSVGKSKKETRESVATEIVCVVDRSGSMESIKKDAIGGFNNFLNDQKAQEGSATMTLVLFDHEYIISCSGKTVKDVEPFNERTYVPRGSTALMDATGRAINELNQRNPKKAIVMILTDGHENSSREFTKQQIKQMISDCEGKGWMVIYLSADASAFDDAKSIGLGVNQVMNFAHDSRGAHIGTQSMSYACNDYRAHGRSGMQPMSCYSARALLNFDSASGLNFNKQKKKHGNFPF